MEIESVRSDRKRFLGLLLLGDEQEDMIDRYLDAGDMYVMKEGDESIGQCVVKDIGGGVLEIKNIAVVPKLQRRGYGRMLMEFIEATYRGRYCILQVGTGDSPSTIPFYEKHGFRRSHIVRNFFIDNYDHEIYEDGVKLVDMIILRKKL